MTKAKKADAEARLDNILEDCADLASSALRAAEAALPADAPEAERKTQAHLVNALAQLVKGEDELTATRQMIRETGLEPAQLLALFELLIKAPGRLASIALLRGARGRLRDELLDPGRIGRARKERERERNAAALRAAEDEAARAQGTVAALKGKLQ